MIPICRAGPAGSSANYLTYGATNSWAWTASSTHYFTPHWRTNIALGYQRTHPPTAGDLGRRATRTTPNLHGGRQSDLVADEFRHWLQLDYMRVDEKLQDATAANVGAS